MSTRGVIARLNGDGFKGRYHHWSSHPSGLGATLYEWAQHMPLERMLKFLLDDHPAGWSDIVGTDYRLAPGWVDTSGMERTCTVCGLKGWEHYRQYYGQDGRPPLPERFAHVPKNVYLLTDHTPKPEAFPDDNRPQCYCHGERHEPQDQVVTDQDAAASGCEWAYVFDEARQVMLVMSSFRRDGHKMIGMFGSGDPDAVWRLVATVDLRGPEPDWDEIARKGGQTWTSTASVAGSRGTSTASSTGT